MSSPVGQRGILYGGFPHQNDGGPEHMWFEYDGFWYDTMPGKPLRRVAIDRRNPRSRWFPPCEEGGPFPANLVGEAEFTLTEKQLPLIQSRYIKWQTVIVSGREVGFYSPA